jgi:DNA-binding NarL/FixJ family response regulator
MFKTLIVEDNAVYSRSLSELLRVRFPDMLVAEAAKISEALSRLIEIRPGLVFVDIKLQEENGLDLVTIIRKSYPDVLIAVITGSNFPEYRSAAYAAGAHYFVPKGDATSSDILQLVDSILTRAPPPWSLGADLIDRVPSDRKRRK